jgi:hypothetical protein
LVVRLKYVWDGSGPIFYASRKPAELQGWLDDRLAEGSFTAFAADYSMFDNSHSRQSWEFMENLYRSCGSDYHTDFSKVMDQWRRPHGFMSGKGWTLKYQADIMNCSGRDDTSLANGVLNGMAIFLSATAAYYRVSPSELTDEMLRQSPIRVAVSGDDSLGFMPCIPLDQHPDFKARLSINIGCFGFDADGDKIVMVDNNPIELVFLGMRPYPVGNRWLWGRTIGRALYKFGWKTGPVFGDLAAWFTGECRAIVETQKHVPLLYDMCAAYLRTREGCRETAFTADAFRPWADFTGFPTAEYDSGTLRAVASLYGVSFGAILDCREHAVAAIERATPCVISHPVLTSIVSQDDM